MFHCLSLITISLLFSPSFSASQSLLFSFPSSFHLEMCAVRQVSWKLTPRDYSINYKVIREKKTRLHYRLGGVWGCLCSRKLVDVFNLTISYFSHFAIIIFICTTLRLNKHDSQPRSAVAAAYISKHCYFAAANFDPLRF